MTVPPAEQPPRAPVVVALDGPGGSGKSSVARRLAAALGAGYLDTGAMYRAVTWAVLQAGIDPQDAAAVTARVLTAELRSGTDPTAPTITLDGADVSTEIRSEPVTLAVSAVSAVPEVRAHLVAAQRAAIAGAGTPVVVVEGRDIASVVCPAAAVKIFLTASPEVRAARRAGQTGQSAPEQIDATLADLHRRDTHDSGRAVAPLLRTDDAVLLDTSELDLARSVAATLEICAAAGVRPAVRS
ncbi:MAG: cmk [Mycobacterium sp.]|nr:cmk [Mycobacterium sp.]